MNFTFTDDQLALAGTVRDVLRAHCPPAALRAERLPAWAELASLGFFGLLVPQEFGGLGLELVDMVAALEETGRACLPGPLVETAVAAPYLLEDDSLAKLASGELRVSVLLADQTYALDADLADLLVVGRSLVSRDLVRLTPYPSADPCRHLFGVSFGEATPLRRPAVQASKRAVVATAAQLIGVARHLLDTTVGYARTRTQFGSPIGAFQAVKHQLADVAVAVDFAAPLVHRAALSVDLPTGARDSSAAFVSAGEAAERAARVALQVHGAIGYTHELDLRFWLARVWSLTAAFGGVAVHRARLRAAILGTLPPGRWP
ncbi:acyl-CoA dehydrogenase family protein [Nonomuraea sp. NPDC050556]|uniref:acyl-CoA dehydrogenase family protein n=1 Tax=Nonomuraea sp. NPDC050556 TaxID=3364369 RepID=UPI0037BA3D35